jgi:ADP-ribose pyrophosphatase
MAQDVAIVEHPGAVAVAALDEQGRLTLVRQYRPAAGDWLTEIPAGRLEPPESPLEAAQRELEEEAGLSAAHWTLLREFFPAPGFCSERVYLFLARELSSVGPNRRPPDPDEELEILHMAPSEVLASSIRDAKTLLAAALLE